MSKFGYNVILKKLLTGEYTCLAKRRSAYRKSEWCIYTGKMSPVKYIGKRSFLPVSVFTKEKHGVYTLDLRKVRALHGNCWLKKLYKKQLKEKQSIKL